MNLEFKNTVNAPAEKVEEIIILGKKVGIMYTRKYEFSGENYYHSVINLPGDLGLIQGCASTKEESVALAISEGKENAKELLRNIHALEAQLNA